METENSALTETFLTETQSLAAFVSAHPKAYAQMVQNLSVARDAARLCSRAQSARICAALASVYQSLSDKKIEWSENLHTFISILLRWLLESAKKTISEEDVLNAVVYADKAAAGEIFDANLLSPSKQPTAENAETESTIPDKHVSIPFAEVNTVLNTYEELIARTYKITSELEGLPSSALVSQISGDISFLQKNLFQKHKTLLSLVQDEPYFVENHRDFYGFFVQANGKKYFIPSEHIIDVVSEDVLDYATVGNQRNLRRTETDENGEEHETLIPVYALSSLMPGKTTAQNASLDIVMIAQYLNQRIGIIVESVQRFATLVKKPLPRSFRHFSLLEGIVFDEQYDLIPILHIPEVMKRFRSQRSYDIKKFEAATRVRTYKILVVDDSETTRQILTTILRGNGFAVESAEDGIVAMEKIHAKQFDLIVTDDEMPRMNGEILVDNLRHLEQYARVPVVAMASEPIEGANACIKKSDFKRGELIKTIEELLQ